ncbi:MAG: hypothetical protein KAJ53_10600, partial [Anaerolineales bacterium]|nr:hypothetical protein [Anaerolineales bacterium]
GGKEQPDLDFIACQVNTCPNGQVFPLKETGGKKRKRQVTDCLKIYRIFYRQAGFREAPADPLPTRRR